MEGTSGSTGISLALMGNASGYRTRIVMPDDAAREKSAMMRLCGADVQEVPPASIVNDGHYSNVAARHADETEGAVFTDQFENEANTRAHYTTTGPEIWAQCSGRLDAFVMSAGTGGTISGVGRYLKEQDAAVGIYLADAPGSVLYSRVTQGVAYVDQQAERKLERHRFDTITEGIGCALSSQVAGQWRATV